MADDNQDQGYVPLIQPGKPVPLPQALPQAQAQPQTGATDQGYVPLVQPKQAGGQGSSQQPPPPPGGQPSQGWGVDWRSGKVTMPQSAQDWASVANNEQAMDSLPGLRTQADAARKRLDPLTAASADVVGSALSPTTLLTPFLGPEAAGAAHEGIKSYMSQPNWLPDAQGWKTIGEDTAAGAAAGLAGRGVAAAAPKVLPQLAEEGTKGGLTYLTHKAFGGLAGGDLMKEAIPLLGLYRGLNTVGQFAGETADKFASSPVTQQAIKSLILGAGSAARNAAGPWNQWVPGQ